MPTRTFKRIALIMAAGQGTRVGGSVPKQYQSLKGQSILSQSIQVFLNHPDIDAVRVVIRSGDEDKYAKTTLTLQSPKLLSPVIGGAERQESVRNGLESLEDYNPSSVLIHDGARPYVNSDVIRRVIQGLDSYKGVIPGVAVVDTLKRAPQDIISETVNRDNLFRAQTPQGFDFLTILSAHRQLKDFVYTDDARLLEHLDIPVLMVQGDPMNQKITTPEDFKGGSMTVPDIRVGHGIDVHEMGPGKGVMIAGVFIPADFSLIGHSDADVGLHSLTDALLGAIGDGDIGQHFNPNDGRWRGADSSLFLKDAVRRVREQGGWITNVDVTIVGERPKISPYREQMGNRIAEILEIESGRVSVKATTTEKLGFLGRGEGLAAFATATVIF